MVKHTLKFLILGLRPLLGPASCRYEIGCTQYALNQLEEKRLVQAIWLIIKRVFSCW
jgi:putative component of membrane protein insertase Oxa1/YidC/SpoIIIJ protein YidD